MDWVELRKSKIAPKVGTKEESAVEIKSEVRWKIFRAALFDSGTWLKNEEIALIIGCDKSEARERRIPFDPFSSSKVSMEERAQSRTDGTGEEATEMIFSKASEIIF